MGCCLATNILKKDFPVMNLEVKKGYIMEGNKAPY